MIDGQKSSSIDVANSTISIERPYGTNINSLKPVFSLSPGAYAMVAGKLQVTGITLNNFRNPLTYTVYAENRDVHKDWTVTILNQTLPVEKIASLKNDIIIYPNPSRGIITLQFLNVQTTPVRIDIFSVSGEIVYTNQISKTGDFKFVADHTKLHAGVYIVKYSGSEKPVIISIQKQ